MTRVGRRGDSSIVRVLVVAAVALASSGCATLATAPPVRTLAMETPGPLEPGTFAVDGGGGQHMAAFGPAVSQGAVRVRHGLPGRVELGVGGEVLDVAVPREDETTEPRRHVGAVSGSLKYTPGRVQRGVAITSAAGGGWSPGGTHFGADLGFVLGIENPWFTPFFNAKVMVGVPVTERELDFGECNDCPKNRAVSAPRLSLAEAFSVGGKAVFPEFRAGRTWVGLRLLVGMQLGWIHDVDPREAPQGFARNVFFQSPGATLEITLGRVRQWPDGWRSSYLGAWPRR